jgi:hypothetical protein
MAEFISKGPGRLTRSSFKISLRRNKLTLTTETTADTILDVMSEQGHVYELSLKVKTTDSFKTPCWGTKFITTKALAHSSVADADPGSCAFLTHGSGSEVSFFRTSDHGLNPYFLRA